MSVGRHVYSVQRWFWVREMADPMTNMEIEDVLSSIRRLVSEDLRPGFRAESPVEPVVVAGDEGKLVLTPAFRVTDAPPVVKPDQAQVWRRAASRYRPSDVDPGPARDTANVADGHAGEQGETGFSQVWPEAGDEGLSDDAPPDGAPSDDAPSDDAQAKDAPFIDMGDDGDLGPDRDVTADAVVAAADFGAARFTEPMAEMAGAGADLAAMTGGEDAGATAFDSPQGSGSDSAMLEAAIAELEAAVAASGDDWEPDGSEVTAGAHFILPPMGHGRVLPEMAEAYGLTPGAAGAGPRRLHLEPGDPLDDPSEPVWTDRGHSAAGPADLKAASSADTAVAASMFAAEEAVLDEGMLRELVIEVIRQELQGALGERITRNVRKLVRAEIHRAIAGREFE